MTDLSDNFGFPTPEGNTTPPHVPTHMKALSDAIDSHLAAGGGFLDHDDVKIDGEQTRTATTYGTLGTPDQVTVEHEGGLLEVNYRALVKATSSGCRVAVFVATPAYPSGLQLYGPVSGSYPPDAETLLNATAYRWLMSDGLNGLRYNFTTGLTGDTDEIDTDVFPLLVGPSMMLEAPAGPLTVSVRYKAASGQTISVKERHLRVSSRSF